jgi:hypothetical protein
LSRSAFRRLVIAVALFTGLATCCEAQIVILTMTGATRDGLPVMRLHPEPAATMAVLTRGYSGRLLRLYALEQQYLREKTGISPEPAYLVLSERQGGFARFGFYLEDQKKPDAGWIDLHRSSRLSGRFGAMDQIFPHELLHVIVRQLAGAPRGSGANQIHALGVRTDPVVAFNEGFAEHAQVLSIDDSDAVEDTRALPGRADIRRRAERELAAFARDLTTRWWPIEPSRVRFLLWFGQTEQVQRYHAVKANLFARLPSVPETLLTRDPYRAYLLQSVMPGPPDGARKPANVALSTEGAVAHLFWKLVTDDSLRRRYRQEEFYAPFGTSRQAVTGFENIYLKVFSVLHEARPSTAAEMLRGWARVHPDDASDVRRIARTALLEQDIPATPEIWLANEALQTGTSLFDQFRALPRVHTFDVNAATPFDWVAVPGVTSDLAARLIADAPYASLGALLASPALSAPLRARMERMAAAMTEVVSQKKEDEETLDVWAIVRGYLLRLSAIVLMATLTGAWLARTAGVRRYWTASLVSATATALVIALAWVITSPGWYRAAAPVLLGGVPWAAWRLAQGCGVRAAATALVTWALAAIPGLVLTASW